MKMNIGNLLKRDAWKMRGLGLSSVELGLHSVEIIMLEVTEIKKW